jgi:hypothetical protein
MVRISIYILLISSDKQIAIPITDIICDEFIQGLAAQREKPASPPPDVVKKSRPLSLKRKEELPEKSTRSDTFEDFNIEPKKAKHAHGCSCDENILFMQALCTMYGIPTKDAPEVSRLFRQVVEEYKKATNHRHSD